jgi:hypothetical protein
MPPAPLPAPPPAAPLPPAVLPAAPPQRRAPRPYRPPSGAPADAASGSHAPSILPPAPLPASLLPPAPLPASLQSLLQQQSAGAHAAAHGDASLAGVVTALAEENARLEEDNVKKDETMRKMAAANAKLTAALAQQEEEHTCAICLDAPRSTVLLPCRHLALCGAPACAAMLGAQPLCPLCRKPVAELLAVFACG